MTCYESIILFMNKWIGILARCANELLHHDDIVPINSVRIFSWWSFFILKKGRKDHERQHGSYYNRRKKVYS